MDEAWARDASSPVDYHAVRTHVGRKYILRLTTGADLWLAVQQFAKDEGIRFAKIHAAFMGGLQPADSLFGQRTRPTRRTGITKSRWRSRTSA